LRTITIAGRQFSLPRSRAGRVALGAALVVGGFVGFLPVLGFWMIPLGLIVLSIDLALVRRHRRRLQVWWGRRRTANGESAGGLNDKQP
jgi:purine-cytosine permease-like protein